MLIGLIISKSLIEVGVVRAKGTLEDNLGDRGPTGGGLVRILAFECLRLPRRVEPSRVSAEDEETCGEAGGVTMTLGSSMFDADFLVLIVRPAEAGGVPGEPASEIGGTDSSGEDGAIMGSAKASGEETEEGVDDRVVSCREPKAATEEGGARGTAP